VLRGSTPNAHSESGRMAVCCQNQTLDAFSNRSALSVLVGAKLKKFGLFLNKPRISLMIVGAIYNNTDFYRAMCCTCYFYMVVYIYYDTF
jgi:hypothetical protein